jgi:hypothetical protein
LSRRGIVNNGSVSDIVSKCAELFVGIMRAIANAAAADTEFAEEISHDLSKLRTLLAKLPCPVILSPPDELSEDEMPYVEALLEAYADAEGLSELSKDGLDSYRKYKKNFQRQRKDYYAAESVRRGTREAFGNAGTHQFETLKNETYDGIVDVHEQKYENGFDRLGAVMTQAAITPISKCTLRKTDWIGNSEKKGVCHFLVNDDGQSGWMTMRDFITAYGKDFGIADESLHGDNNFKFSEFTVRRDTVNKALKKLVLDGLVNVSGRQTGFVYAVNQSTFDSFNKGRRRQRLISTSNESS